jgi:osmotically inducible protein OsmC
MGAIDWSKYGCIWEKGTMPIRKAQAAWHGTFREGEGKMRLGSGAFEGAYSYRSRMEDSEPGTNPEELLGAAHAGCFSMSLARRLTAEGYSPERIHTEARVRFGRSGEGYAISRIELRTEAEIPGVDEALFLEKAEAAKRDCAVSKALADVEEIALEAKLVEHTG